MVGADLEGLLSTHQDADSVGLRVLEELDVSQSPLLPFRWIFARLVAVQLGSPVGDRRQTSLEKCSRDSQLQQLTLVFLQRLDFDQRQRDDRLELYGW